MSFQYNSSGGGLGINGVSKLEKSFYVAINATIVGDQDLRRQNGTPTNLAPYVSQINGEIYEVTQTSFSGTDWEVQIIINGSAVGSVNQTNGSISQQTTLSSPISVNKGDNIRLRFRGFGDQVIRPSAQIEIREV